LIFEQSSSPKLADHGRSSPLYQRTSSTAIKAPSLGTTQLMKSNYIPHKRTRARIRVQARVSTMSA